MLEKELELEYFRREGFKRYRCSKCGAYFWSVVPRDNCTEAPCGTYTFLERDMFSRRMEIEDMRSYFIEFFKKRGHEPVQRYPVVARWRDDVFLVNASIYDFQPHVTSGLVEPPANPLVISQPCIRMVDVDSVGKTGRHLTGFEMMAHHAFNYPDKHVYWKEETVAYAIELLESLGVKREDIVLKEHPWFGGGNAGASFEVIVGGLELATLVFMNLRENPEGNIEIDGTRYEEMPIKIVDTGYGLERFVWMSKRTPTIYEAVYPGLVDKLLSLTGIEKGEEEERVLGLLARKASLMEAMGERRFIELFTKEAGISVEYYRTRIVPIQKIYAVVDYSRSLSFMLTDGIIPSNIQAGYLARLLIRRALKLLEELGEPVSLYELVEMHAKRFSDILDITMLPTVREEIEIEEERYRKTMERGRSIVKKMLRKGKIDTDTLILLYESHGLLPEIVQRIAAESGVEIEVPENFHALVAKRHEATARKRRKEKREYALPPTEKLYYSEPYMKEFTAKVIYSEGNEVVLDRTAFYPEGGGQPSDRGRLLWDGREFRVEDVQKYGEVVVHRISGEIPGGVEVTGVLDWERRERLMRMHTAEHVLLAACRKVLGRHVWQHGTQKDVHESRFDIAHYRAISRDEIKKIERAALDIITSNIPVEAQFMSRREAEDKYGFVLYEGGIPPGREIRIVKIGDYDVEACGGTHVSSTGEIGFLKILRTERIQDGVSRIIYSAGQSALEKVQELEELLYEAAQRLNSPVDAVPEKIAALQDAWKRERREKEEALAHKIGYMAEKLLGTARDSRLVADVELTRDEMQKLMRLLSERLEEVVLLSHNGDIMVWSRAGRARELARKVAEVMNGKAGGRSELAQGRGMPDRVKEGIAAAKQDMGLI